MLVSFLLCDAATVVGVTAPEAVNVSSVVILMPGRTTDSAVARKQQGDLAAYPVRLVHEGQRREFVQEHGASCYQPHNKKNESNVVGQQFEAFHKLGLSHLAVELWKYCAIYHELTISSAETTTVAFLDPETPMLVSWSDMITSRNMAILSTTSSSLVPHTIHGSFLVLSSATVAARMIQALVETSIRTLHREPWFLSRVLYEYIREDTALTTNDPLQVGWNHHWFLLEHACRMDPLRRRPETTAAARKPPDDDQTDGNGPGSWTDSTTASYRLSYHCPDINGYCCSAVLVAPDLPAGGNGRTTVLLNPHPIYPHETADTTSNPAQLSLPAPYNAMTGHFSEEELPFISTITEVVHHRTPEEMAAAPPTPNFFDVLLANDCLPSHDSCTRCLHNKAGANCQSCGHACTCFCKTLCQETVDAKYVAKELRVRPPVYSRDPNRLIPRIVHQTYFEELTSDKYPNMSRLVESFKQSGWEYKFYSDDDATNFLSTHFPTEVREAYDAIKPGAFKADLFRYCVLLIYGGVYADVDILLESALDLAVPPDMGFMVPIDEVRSHRKNVASCGKQ
jgi:Glycosyltransferase sugar-binding region containing DXD motif